MMNVKTSAWARGWGWAPAAAAISVAALVVGCGGGGGGGSGAVGASAYTAGPVRGFGSIIVNGVRFDDSSAQVENEDGVRGSSDDIKLGSMVEVESEKVDDSTGRAKASRIRFGSELVGPVASVDATNSSFVMLDQTVEVKPETVFDDSLAGGLAALTGKVVEVHAQRDAATGHYVASRVESEAGATAFKLRGVVSALDATAKTFKIGAAVINYGGIAAADLPAGLADGLKVRVKLQTAQVNSQWVATAVRTGERHIEDHDDGRLMGNVTAFTSAIAFEVNGIVVDASTARIDNGPVTADSRVEVRGPVKDGKVVATRVTVLKASDDSVRGVELHGTISDVDTTAKTFMLRGLKVSFAGTVTYERGTEAQLVAGAKVEAKGPLSADGTTLSATLIRFED